MCGIVGIIHKEKPINRQSLEAMSKKLLHRGPDDEGIEIFHSNKASAGFGFRRLSIIDLTPSGHQPMQDSTSGNWIVFNGEIYNYKEIRKELIELGHSFKSQSDTEVILKSYLQWGKKCVEHFIGMFAIALFDKAANKILLFRDRVGVKPLYYYHDGDVFLFSSELKSFHENPDFKKEVYYDSLPLYFKLGYIPAPYTINNNTYKLLPGHILEIDLNRWSFSIEKYWSVTDVYNKPKLNMSIEEATEELERILISSCLYRTIADVPVGVFLSGGYDSSAVTALLAAHGGEKVKSFTIGFHEQSFNEADYAREVANHLQTDHHEYYCTQKDALELMPDFYKIFDEPFSEAVAIPNVLVSRLARKHVKVALSADAGDEIFAGYSRHHKMFLDMIRLQKIPYPIRYTLSATCKTILSKKVSSLVQVDRKGRYCQLFSTNDPLQLFLVGNQCFSDNEIDSFMKLPFVQLGTPFDNNALLNDGNDMINRILACEHQTYLADDILHKVDITSMFTSLEAREPLLDHRVLEFASRLPSDFKLKGSTGKYILRKIVHKYIPEKMVNRAKRGFGIPVHLWGTRELKNYFDEVMTSENLKHHGFFNEKMVMDLYHHYQKGNHNVFERVWLFISFQMWYNRYIMQA
ncbi:MAG TPA: asparagine synthase (glutamine-hydrolyzing) [Bacteroidia bacterium]|nr:asparagine synthase (glutamine-hydrolyzing) [Bacteroidia bacterium]